MNNPTLEERAACCAHLNVKYEPIDHGGQRFTERWLCVDCAEGFLPSHRIRQAEKDARLDEFKKFELVWSDHTDEYVKPIEEYVTNRRKQLEES